MCIRDRRKIKLEGKIEAKFIYASLLGGDLLPFGYTVLRPIVLPLEQRHNKYELLDVPQLRARGYPGIANWLEKAQRVWEELGTEKAKENFPRLLNAVNYHALLTSQSPTTRFIVLYNSSGTNIVSCVIDKHSLETFTLLETVIKPMSFIADKDTRFYETNNELEAHYLCAILNSNIVNNVIKPLQTRGLFGERHIHRRPFMLPIPKFDPNNPVHLRLAELSKLCHEKVAKAKSRFTGKSVTSLRRQAREVVKEELKEIDKLVSQLLGVGGEVR